jgi:polysaccharide biosynthesis protein PslH
VEVTGSVPDVRPHVRGAALTIAPLKIARGTQNKILESLAMGVPVVASSQAAGGVDAVPGRELLVADRPAELARLILEVLGSPERRAELSGAGRQRMLQQHDWSASMRRLDGMIETCLTGRQGDPGVQRSGSPA